MSVLRARRLLWLGLLILLPVPFFGIESGLVPVARLLLLGSLVAGVALQDPDWMSRLFAGIFLGQGLLWAALLYGVARLAVRWLPRPVPLGIVVLLAVASLFPIYSTPFSASSPRSSILQILD
jgi:hypothetical protein